MTIESSYIILYDDIGDTKYGCLNPPDIDIHGFLEKKFNRYLRVSLETGRRLAGNIVVLPFAEFSDER